jgi:hypothetical protein
MAEQKISEMTEATLPLDGTEDMEIVQSAVTRRCSTQDIADLAGLPYKSYNEILSAASTANPTAIALENTLSAAIVWTRSSTGIYIGTLVGAFTVNKTVMCVTQSTTDVQYLASRLNNDEVRIIQKDLSGSNFDELFSVWVQIRVYL